MKIFKFLLFFVLFSLNADGQEVLLIQRVFNETKDCHRTIIIKEFFSELKKSGDTLYFKVLDIDEKRKLAKNRTDVNEELVKNGIENDGIIPSNKQIREQLANSYRNYDYLIFVEEKAKREFNFEIWTKKIWWKEVFIQIPDSWEPSKVKKELMKKFRPYFPYTESREEQIAKKEKKREIEKKKIEEEKKRKQFERGVWSDACNTNTTECYNDYLSSYPDGIYVKQANLKLKQLKQEKKNANWRTAKKVGLGVGTLVGVSILVFGKKDEWIDAKKSYKLYAQNKSPLAFKNACPSCGSRIETLKKANILRKERRKSIIYGGVLTLVSGVCLIRQFYLPKAKNQNISSIITQDGFSLIYKF